MKVLTPDDCELARLGLGEMIDDDWELLYGDDLLTTVAALRAEVARLRNDLAQWRELLAAAAAASDG
jgi:uncharacterized small protein (DUF1192 family)